ncbi:MAG: hypothetical protein ABIB41_02125 [Nitrospirota bacterium]
MKQNIRQSLKFSIPVVIFLTAFFSWIAGFEEGFVPGLLIGLFVGGLIALIVAFIFSESAKEGFADFRLDKEKRSRMASNFKKLLPNLSIILMGAVLTRYTGKIYLLLITSIVLSMTVTFLQSIKSGEYKKASEEGELTAFYALIVTLPISLISLFILFLLLVYGGNVKEIIKLL